MTDPCPRCDGTGWAWGDPPIGRMVRCGGCRGTGRRHVEVIYTIAAHRESRSEYIARGVLVPADARVTGADLQAAVDVARDAALGDDPAAAEPLIALLGQVAAAEVLAVLTSHVKSHDEMLN